MRILAIESSCDETAVSILDVSGAKAPRFFVLSDIISSQVKIHAEWGGVVPGLAKREHQNNLVSVLTKSLRQAKLLNLKPKKSLSHDIQNKLEKILEREPMLLKKTIKFLEKYDKPKIDAVAVTYGPGLEPALWVGVNFAKALSAAWNKPIIPVNHMEGHLFSVFLPKDKIEFEIPKPSFPAIALLVSGGHTEIVFIKDWNKYELTGQTRDDAAGEAFDKVAKMLGLGYPGGPAVSRLAAQQKSQIQNHKSQINSKSPEKLRLGASKIQNSKILFPRPMMNSKDFDFSFSGLKTAVLYKIKEFARLTSKIKAEICCEFQQAAVDVLVSKTIKAAKKYKAKTVILGGGVSANKELREQLEKACQENIKDCDFFAPNLKSSGDNAAMIALAAYFRTRNKKDFDRLAKKGKSIKADGNLSI